MKRGIQKRDCKIASQPRQAVALRDVRGGASMVEYALLADSHRIPMIQAEENAP
jgi:hypothetical protein